VIGAHLAEQLATERHEVALFDVAYERERFASQFKQIRGDITKGNDLDKLPANTDIVVHCAAISRAELAERQPERCMNVNVIGLDNIVRWSLRQKAVPHIIFASSREVYGNPDTLPVPESHLRQPRSTYGRSKALGEALLAYYGTGHNQPYTILRFSNVYGSVHDLPERVVPAFARNALSNLPLTLFGGEQVLDFVYIDDAISGIVQLIDGISRGRKEVCNATYNICSGRGISIGEVARLTKAACASDSEIRSLASREFDARAFIGNYSKARADLGYGPSISFEHGLSLYLSKLRGGKSLA